MIDPTGSTIGWAKFAEDATGTVHVNVHVQGISPGLHGIHLHATGACTLGTATTFSSAGGHHNPLDHSTASTIRPAPTPATCRTSS